jgi:hypothetical protein
MDGCFNRISKRAALSAFPQVGGQSGIQPEAGHPDAVIDMFVQVVGCFQGDPETAFFLC